MTKSSIRGRTIRFTFKSINETVKFFNNSNAESGKNKFLCIKTNSVTILI